MVNSRLPRIALRLSLIALMTSSVCYADADCFDLYQWSSDISFSAGNVVRDRGAAYRAIKATQGEAPVNNSQSWAFIGMCRTQTNEKDISCDFNGDGKADYAKGFPAADLVTGKSYDEIPLNEPGLMNAGEVAIFYDKSQVNKPADQVWNQNILAMNAYAKRNARFGETLTTGDFNNDHFCDLAIGSPSINMVNILYGSSSGLTTIVLGENGRPVNPYAAQLFNQSTDDVTGTPEAGDDFGYALGAGDINGDGFDDLVVGVPREDFVIAKINRVNAGYVHVIFGSGNGLQTRQPLTVSYDQNMGRAWLGDAETGDRFGQSIDVADFDHDGFADVVLTAPHEIENGSTREIGKVSLFRGSRNGIDVASRINITPKNFAEGTNWSLFGLQTRTTDFNGDGYIDLEIDLTNYDYDNPVHPYLTMQVPGSATGLLFTNVSYRDR